jgi:hypothetical protein
MTRLTTFALTLLTLCAALSASAQMVRSGPWSGGVTSNWAEVVLGLLENRLTSIEVSTHRDFPRYETFAENQSLLGSPTNLARYSLRYLKPDTTYYYRIRASNLRERERNGSFRTLPVEGQPASFRVAIAADALTDSESSVFSEIRFQKPLFFLHLGNFHHHPLRTSNAADYYVAYETALRSANQTELYGSIPIVYTWDRLDFGGEPARQLPGPTTVANEVYRQIVPHHPLVTNSQPTAETELNPPPPQLITQAFTCGRVRFIILDTRSDRDPVETPDGPGKPMIGAWQLEWLKQELVAAAQTHPLIFIATSTAWHGTDSKNSDDWARYQNERREISDWIRENELNGICFLSGNGGVLAVHNGSNVIPQSELNFPEFHVGPIDLKRTAHAGEWTQSPIRPQDIDEFFGLIDIDDQGSSIQVKFAGLNQYAQKQLESSFTIQVPRR